MEKLELLKGVRKHLSNPENWYKGGYAPGGCVNIPKGCVCLLGAANYVADPDRNYSRDGTNYAAETILDRGLVGCVPAAFERDGFVRVASFNDHPDTTHADILKVLDCAIAKAEGPVS